MDTYVQNELQSMLEQIMRSIDGIDNFYSALGYLKSLVKDDLREAIELQRTKDECPSECFEKFVCEHGIIRIENKD